MHTLRPYQQAGIDKYADTDGAFFNMTMRLGKTLTCIRWIKQHKLHPRKILIVAPKTVLISWEKELQGEECPYVSLVDYKLKERHSYMSSPAEGYALCNYETISSLERWNCLASFDCVVLDESICIKNPNAKATKHLLKAAPHIPLRACLTGLVNPESWMEVWPQVAFANGGEWMGYDNFYKWRDAYFQNYGFEWILSPRSAGKISAAFNDDVYVMTRQRAGIRDVKIRQHRIGVMSSEAREAYEYVDEKWELPGEVMDEDGVVIEEGDQAKIKLVVVSWLRRICGGVIPTKPIQPVKCWKHDELLHILQHEIEPSESVVVWFAFNAEIAAVFKLLTNAGESVTWITGAASQEDRRERIRAFDAGEYRIMLIQQKCGQYGIDLGRADTAIYFSCDHSYNLRSQSEERIYRVGKPNDLLIIDLITEDSMDESVVESIKEKKSDASLLLARLCAPSKTKRNDTELF